MATGATDLQARVVLEGPAYLCEDALKVNALVEGRGLSLLSSH